MVKYVALLRGINVGGNNIIKMADLRACFEKNGFTNVITYIQSGNVVFDSSEKDKKKLEQKIETFLSKTFKYKSIVLIRSSVEIRKILASVPKEWNTNADIRCYVGFVKEPTTPKEVVTEITLKEGVDSIATSKGVVYMTTLTSGLSKSGFNKIPAKKIYQQITIRNYNSTKKIAALMESK